MPVKMYDRMWEELKKLIAENSLTGIGYSMDNIEKLNTFITQPEAIYEFDTSKQTLKKLRDAGMPYVTRGTGQQEQFFYKEEEVRSHLEELRGKK